MGLVGELIRRSVVGAVKAIEFGYEVLDHPGLSAPAPCITAAPMSSEGPDDLWPADDPTPAPQILDSGTDSELVLTHQWGLRLPNGDVHWGQWNDTDFSHPLGRLRMISILQKTALDVGFSEGLQVSEFLCHYGWVTRNQISRVVYEDTGSYALTDKRVSATDSPVEGENHGSQDSPSAPQENPTCPRAETEDISAQPGGDSRGDLRPGSVGGAAQ
jgi:hypothetical protein